jgi:hypothetical protein
VVGLDTGGGRTLGSRALDHVRIDGALGQEVELAQLSGLLLEDADESVADDATLLLGLGNTFQSGEETIRGIDRHQVHVNVAAECVHHFPGLILAQEAVVDKEAGQVVPDGAVDKGRCHRGIDPAAEAAQDPAVTYGGLDLLNRRGDERMGGPGSAEASDFEEEVRQDLRALRGVHHFRVELDAEQGAPAHGGERSVVGGGKGFEALGHDAHPVAMAHPDRKVAFQPREKRIV